MFIKKQTQKIKKTFLILQYSPLKSTTAGIQGHIHTFESSQLEDLYVGDLLYLISKVVTISPYSLSLLLSLPSSPLPCLLPLPPYLLLLL